MIEPRFGRDDLRSGQRLIVDLMRRHPAHLIVSGMGSGKTAASLTAMRDLLDLGDVRHWLVVGPLHVARRTWPDEVAAWRHTRPLRYAVAVGTDKERAAAVAARAELTFINFESLQWLAKHIGSVENWYWDGLVIDESSRFKGGKMRTSRTTFKDAKGCRRTRKGGALTRFGVIAVARKKIKRVYELTGTPRPQGIEDLWGQVYVLDQGERLERTLSAFHDRWFTKNAYTYQVAPRPGAEAEILAAVSDIITTIPPERVTDEPTFVRVPVALPPKVMRDYREFERTLVSETYDVEAVSRGVLANKLLQLANGSLIREDRSVVPVHTAKIDALAELVKQAAGENMLVFYGYRFDLATIRARFPHVVVANEEPDAIERWNRGEIRLMAAHPASIGHGTNLQFGGHLACWFGLTWSLELYQQANMRLPRPGQKHPVTIYQIVAEGTYDEAALAALERKGAGQEAMKAALLAHIRGAVTT